jgi:3-oxosteroid 1-dehydrogenase
VVSVREHCDVLVVGSGAAGLLAACRAADAGHDVLLLERSSLLGGTTATSGGVLWVPANEPMLAAGYRDSPALGVEHLLAVTQGKARREQLDWFVRTAGLAVRYLHARTAVRLVPLTRADHHWDLPGAAAAGRALDNLPFDTTAHPELVGMVRPATYLPELTMAERESGLPPEVGAEVQEARRANGVRTLGGALVGALAASALARGVRLVCGSRLVTLDRASEGVWRAVAGEGAQRQVVVRVAVVLASGGFEWDDDLREEHLGVPLLPVGAPGNEGDGLRLALAAGAAVDELGTWWGAPVLHDPSARYDGRPTGRMASVELAAPGALLVDRGGRRFVDESANYHDIAHALARLDPATGKSSRAPAWLVYDAACARHTSIAGLPVGTPPAWAQVAPTLADLARAIHLPVDALADTVARFNAGALDGRDPDFGRGRAPARAVAGGAGLAPLAEAPYHALPILAGTLGTSGGVVTDDRAQVLDGSGKPVPGLFAAGNVAATVFGGAYPGGGASLALAAARAYAVGAALADGPGHGILPLRTAGVDLGPSGP